MKDAKGYRVWIILPSKFDDISLNWRRTSSDVIREIGQFSEIFGLVLRK